MTRFQRRRSSERLLKRMKNRERMYRRLSNLRHAMRNPPHVRQPAVHLIGGFHMRSRVELRKILTAATFLLTLSVLACENKETAGFKPEIQPLPAGLARYEAMEIPADNPMTPEKVALGRQLFFDKRLSGDGSRSCYFCHVCEHGLTDGQAKATGAFNKPLPRSSPTLWNIGYQKMFYWDGRSPSLEKQAMAAWQLGNMGAKDHEA